MATLKTNVPATWTTAAHTNTHISIWDKFTAFADSQHERRAMWFFAALIVQGVIFLPLPAFLIYYYNAPTVVLMITMTCFFTLSLPIWAVPVSGAFWLYQSQAY
jgi:hypothetical protein